jgi:hypothetical protein
MNSCAAFCISLRANEAGRKQCEEQFQALGVPVQFEVVDPHPQGGVCGCFTSHQLALQRGLDSSSELILIMEDDVCFEGCTPELFQSLLRWVKQVPADQRWCLELGYFTYSKSYDISPGIVALDNCVCAHAYVVPRLTAQGLCAMNWRGTPYDLQWGEVIDQFYAPYPMVAFQRNHISTISHLSTLFMMVFGFRTVARICEWWSRRYL